MQSAWSLAALAAALAIDRAAGDPPWLWRRAPHPVVLIGRAIDTLEARMNAAHLPFATRRRRGTGALLALALAGAGLGLAVGSGLAALPLRFLIEVLFVAVLLAQKSLVDHVAAVALALDKDQLAGGRAEVAKIVGRDVSALDEAGVARAAIESAAENFSDGVVAPAFWYALLGLPGLIAFKIVSTADSMIGHRSPRYEAFGWAAARLDDGLNFVPARLSAALIWTAAAVTGRDAGKAIASAFRDARLHKSPNAGWPEAAMAGALGLALGGPRRYGELEVDGAWLNASGRPDAGANDIRAAVQLIDGAWVVLLGAVALTALSALWIAQ